MSFKIKRRIYAEIGDLTIEIQDKQVTFQVDGHDAYSRPIKVLDLRLGFEELGLLISLLEEFREELRS